MKLTGADAVEALYLLLEPTDNSRKTVVRYGGKRYFFRTRQYFRFCAEKLRWNMAEVEFLEYDQQPEVIDARRQLQQASD